MSAILILLIIFLQFAVVYFSVKHLTILNERIIALNSKVIEVNTKLTTMFQKAREKFIHINEVIEKFLNNKNKLTLMRNLMLLKSLAVTIILIKKRKSIFNFLSLYGIMSKLTKTLLEY